MVATGVSGTCSMNGSTYIVHDFARTGIASIGIAPSCSNKVVPDNITVVFNVHGISHQLTFNFPQDWQQQLTFVSYQYRDAVQCIKNPMECHDFL